MISAYQFNLTIFVFLILLVAICCLLFLIVRRSGQHKKISNNLTELRNALQSLWEVEKIVLNTLDFEEVVKNVANTILTQLGYLQLGYEIVVLALKEDSVLRRISISQTEGAKKFLDKSPKHFREIIIPLSDSKNLCVRTINENRVFVTHNVADLLSPALDKEFVDKLQKEIGIKSSMVYPVTSRGNVLGVLIFSMRKSEDQVTDYEQVIINSFVSAVGIAVENSQLYGKLKETTEQLSQANEKLKELDKLKDDFVSVASHELRTPMTAIKSYLWMALAGKAGEINEKLEKYLDRAYVSTDRLINLVNDMLNVSRIESGRITVNKQSMDIPKLSEEVAEEVKPRALERGLSVSVQMVKDLPLVFGDWNKIREVLLNLVGNSLKFTNEGGKIIISFNVKADFVEITVADTGVGISKEDQERLFTKFGLGQHSYTTAHKSGESGGSGLGLYITKSLIELHGGQIWFKSEEGKGSQFSFSLPIATEEQIKKFGTFDENHIVKEEIGPGGSGIIPTQHL